MPVREAPLVVVPREDLGDAPDEPGELRVKVEEDGSPPKSTERIWSSVYVRIPWSGPVPARGATPG